MSNLLKASPVIIAQELAGRAARIKKGVEKTSGEEGDRRIGATAIIGSVTLVVAAGAAVFIDKFDFNPPKPPEIAMLSVEACEAYDRRATEILGGLAMDSRLVVIAGASAQGGTEMKATVSDWGTSGSFIFSNPNIPLDLALASPDLAVRAEAVDRFTASADTYLTTLSFNGNRALSSAVDTNGEPIAGEYYADDAPISLAVVGTYHPDNSVSTECRVTSPPKNIHQAGKAETVPVEQVVDVALAVTQDLAS